MDQLQQMYLQQFYENNRTSKFKDRRSKLSLSSLGNKIHQPLAIFKDRVYTIPMFGEGMEYGAAKKLVYSMMYKEDQSWKLTAMYPGVEGIGSGIGFTVNNLKLNLAAMYKYEDRGIFEKVRPIWREFFKTASAFIFVVNVHDDLVKAKGELDTFMSDENQIAPLLVVVCGDTNSAPSGSALVQIADSLGLNTGKMKDRKWSIRLVDLESLQGMGEGLSWLTSVLE